MQFILRKIWAKNWGLASRNTQFNFFNAVYFKKNVGEELGLG
jgi:hypothetical protein